MMGQVYLLLLIVLQGVYIIFGKNTNDSASLELTILMAAFGLALSISARR